MVAMENPTASTEQGDRHTHCICCRQNVAPDLFNRYLHLCLWCLTTCNDTGRCNKTEMMDARDEAEKKRLAKE